MSEAASEDEVRVSDERSPWNPPATRDGSLLYKPTHEQFQHSPILAACLGAGLSETQVIEMLFRESEERRKLIAKLSLYQPPAPIRVSFAGCKHELNVHLDEIGVKREQS